MLERAAVVVLAASIVLGSVTVCPRGGLACPMQKPAGHHCCGSSSTWRAHDCCAGGAHLPSAALTATGADQEHRHSTQAPAPFIVPVTTAGSCWSVLGPQRCLLKGGPAPPDTPITRHTSLLL
ncbi:MAG TPA: hypothetical protein VF515_03190 [Candidatus Binatia bacterium]